MPRQRENNPAMNSVHEMSLLVGKLTGELKGVKESIDGLNRIWGEREHAATEGRRVLHEKFNTMQHDFQRIEATVENVSRDVNLIKPAVDSFKTERNRHEGAKRLSVKLWGAANA